MKLQLFDFHPRPLGPVSVEAFSGLVYKGRTPEGEHVFWTHTDRGPNADPYVDQTTMRDHRPFALPEFQPSLIQFKVKPGQSHAEYMKEILLTLPDGSPLSGLPNFAPTKGRSGDEMPVTLSGEKLPLDKMGIDPESMCFAGNHIWLAEEYGPSLLKFTLEGKLVKRYTPQGYFPGQKPQYVKDILPTELLTRKVNRGFEGLTCIGTTIYAALQSPLPKDGKNIMILEFDSQDERMIRTFYYPLESMDADKIGDLSHRKGKLLVLEQNSKTGPDSFHRIYEVDPAKVMAKGVASKSMILDLVKVGYDFAEKVEGMAIMDEKHIAVINDNDFGLSGTIDRKTHQAVMDPKRKSRLAIIELD